MNGTIITDVKVYSAAGSLVMQAQVGDKVEGPGTALINRLTRNGIQKLAGTYYLGQTGCVAWDTVTPPPDPTPTGRQNMRLTDLDTNESWDFVRKPSV